MAALLLPFPNRHADLTAKRFAHLPLHGVQDTKPFVRQAIAVPEGYLHRHLDQRSLRRAGASLRGKASGARPESQRRSRDMIVSLPFQINRPLDSRKARSVTGCMWGKGKAETGKGDLSCRLTVFVKCTARQLTNILGGEAPIEVFVRTDPKPNPLVLGSESTAR